MSIELDENGVQIIRKNADVHFVGYIEPTIGMHLSARVIKVDDYENPDPNVNLIVWYESPDQNPPENRQFVGDFDAWKGNVPYDSTCTQGRSYHRESDCKQ